jgi:hypothetical protein
MSGYFANPQTIRDRMKLPAFALLFFSSALFAAGSASAGPSGAHARGLASHKAVYDIDLVATHSGSQIINISGKMTYQWKRTCDAWVTDHEFLLDYNYADSPGMRIQSDFSTYETDDGKSLDFTSQRTRDGEMYQRLRGHAGIEPGKPGIARFNAPEGIKFDLLPGTVFPVAHTLELIKKAEEGERFYSAAVFDGSDDEGPIEINSFIGKPASLSQVPKGADIDASLLKDKAWHVRMAVFPEKDREEKSDYEMSLIFHKNGIISDMLIEYDDFSVTQKLVSLEKVAADSCGGAAKVSAVASPAKP